MLSLGFHPTLGVLVNDSIKLNVVPPEDLQDVSGWLGEIATALARAEVLSVQIVTEGVPVVHAQSSPTDPCPTKYTMLMYMGPCPGRSDKDPFQFEFSRVNPAPDVPGEKKGGEE